MTKKILSKKAGLFFQDDEEIDVLAASLLSQARTTGVVRNKVGCLCLDMVTFYLDWFVF